MLKLPKIISLKEIPSRVYIRYGLLTIPGTVVLILVLIVVRNWVPIPLWLQVTLIFLWIAKEVILFPFIWRAYDHTRSEVFRSMIGERGITRQRLAPAGYIQVQGELWKAEKMLDEPPIEKNRWVRVKKIEGLKLYVVSEETGSGIRKSACDELPSTCSGPELVERQANRSWKSAGRIKK